MLLQASELGVSQALFILATHQFIYYTFKLSFLKSFALGSNIKLGLTRRGHDGTRNIRRMKMFFISFSIC